MIRFYNGRVLSFSGGLKISDAEVWTDGGVITHVGAANEDMPAFEREIDLKGDLLIPGFKDAHTHTAMTFLRSFADDMPLDRWLSEQVWPNEAKLTDESMYIFTQLGIMEYLSSGITASFDMYVHNEAYAKANIDSGFRTVICSGLNNFDRDVENIEREYLRFNSLHELVSYRLGIHAEYTTSPERMEYMAGLAEKCRCRWRKPLSGGGYHCTWMSEDDLKLFAEKGLWAITNPASNLKLASGIAPVTKMLERGINMAIGTDGAASNNALDMFREMYLAAALQKVYEHDASACRAEDVLKMACVGGARAMGLPDCDDIAVGKRADLVVINLRRPNMQPLNNIASNIVYAGSKENVRLTMVNGRILYENSEFFIGEQPEYIYAAANAFMEAIRK